MKNTALILGLFILISSLLIKNSINKSEKVVSSLNDEKTSYGVIEGIVPCSWEVISPEKVISENKTEALLINTSNLNNEPCETSLFLRAPNFDISPFKDEQKIVLAPNSTGSISWILTPRKTGNYEIALTDNINTKIYGVSVKSMFGLTAMQAKVASGLGTIFGPMLTIPWWWEKLKKKKELT